MSTTTTPSLATGAPLTPETWADFVQRLTHDCRGEGVNRHFTACALFTVERKVYVYGISDDYSTNLAIIRDDTVWRSMADFLAEDCIDAEERAAMDAAAVEEGHADFASASEWDQREILEKRGYMLTGWDERWEFVGAHHTRDAAEAFIRRKAHDYGDGLRVYVEAQPYAWEFEAIKNAIMDGRLVLKDSVQSPA